MNSNAYHRLLLRQIRKITGISEDISPVDLAKLLTVVSLTYEEYEKSQERSDRAGSLMSDELLQLNKKIQADAQHELALSEQKYYNIVQNISGILFSHYWTDNTIIPQFISRQIDELTGYQAEDFITGAIDFLSILHPDDTANYLETIYKSRYNNYLYQIEYRIIGKDGAHIWVFEQGRIRNENEQSKIDGVIINITKQKHVEQKLIEIAQQAEEANRAKSELLSNMSHELRTPMHSILSYAELGLTGIELNEPIESIKKAFEIISKSGNRLLKLLNSLLDLARMESGKMNYHFAKRDIIQTVNQARQEIQLLAQNKNILITTQFPASPVVIFIDNDKIIQVLVNLISNAIKFSPLGNEVRISIEHKSEEGYVSINVIDQGVGIPEEQLETIFNAFVQSSRTSAGSGGTGLGLSISKEIIKAHDGWICAFNNKNKGATVRVDIPLIRRDHENIGNR